ncbi:MAG: DNA ligase [Deltaproteobacteria bacterium]|nr:DNA ligase [Candidatus Tharpella sp.]
MPVKPNNISIETLVAKLENYNNAYRQGQPLISDVEYDNLTEELRSLAPEHFFLHHIEPEKFSGRREIRHPKPMLSTEKAYTQEALKRFIERAEKSAVEYNRPQPEIRLTAKLDGLAARDDGQIFATRGNGETGYEISSAFTKGVVAIGGRGQGLGEIVITNSYFNEYLMAHFEHPRNLVVGIINSDTLNPYAEKALTAGAVQFVPYCRLPAWQGSGIELLDKLDKIREVLESQTDYPLDGLVAEISDISLQEILGHTDHHYRWQIAIKSKGETARTEVVDIVWQVGRTGTVTPVLEVVPVNISGATIRRVTAHNAGMVKEKNLGPGALIEIIRSGEVIPKLEKVIKKAPELRLPEHCPSCHGVLVWNNDFLKCRNPQCPAQVEQQIWHWFKTLGTVDWFGIKTIRRLVENSCDTLEKIYALRENDFLAFDFGPQQAKNLFAALQLSRSKEVDDWRFLAAFGIPSLGRGDSRRLLNEISLPRLIDGVEVEDVAAIAGFAELTAENIVTGIKQRRSEIKHLMGLGFNLRLTEPTTTAIDEHLFKGKGLVFTGTLKSGSREEIEDNARRFGARVQKSVSSKTDYLVCGEKVGARKIEKAAQLGINVISEEHYLELTGAGSA